MSVPLPRLRTTMAVAGFLAVAIAGAGPREAAAPAGAPEVRGASPVTADLAASVGEIEKGLEKLRGLEFKTQVATSLLSREGVRAYLQDQMHRDYPGESLAAEQTALRYFGLLPPGRDLEPILLDLLREQVAGLYDPERKTLFVVPGAALGTVALSHELAHALADQNFDLAALIENARDDDDRALALSALMEGEATMMTALWSIQSGNDPNVPGLAAGGEADLYEEAEAGLASAPPFLREALLFPYLSGSAWAAEIVRKGGGLKALDGSFRRPPESTEQILHPERSLDPRDLPSRIDDAILLGAAPGGSRTVKIDTMGEFATRLLLGEPDDAGAARAADGWDGDRYILSVIENRMSLTWISVWDTERDAEEFREAAAAWLVRRGGPAAAGGAIRNGRTVVVSEGGAAAERAGSITSRLPQGIEILP